VTAGQDQAAADGPGTTGQGNVGRETAGPETANPETAGQASGEQPAAPAPGGTRQVFRSPVAIAVWWIWLLFAVANLIDLAVQGHDHISLVAAFVLILVTGIMYAGVHRPRIIAEDAGLTIVNPLRDHRIGWASVAGVDPMDLVRVRVEWPGVEGPESGREAGTAATGTAATGAVVTGTAATGGRKTIYAWAVYSSRRRQYSAEVRAQRRTRSRGGPGTGGFGGGGFSGGIGRGGVGTDGYGAQPKAPKEPSDSERVVTALNARVDEARDAAQRDAAKSHGVAGNAAAGNAAAGNAAAAPASTWHWPSFAAVIAPAIALVIAILA